ncbi:hypothetical protein E1A91_D01G071200v1 [Gossypium mustelinum]|uniref:Uncharacterized protein n=1 Tax=Gossypium mustelinum TaxID=34275 RepID=A0A5D2W448_GOSMU|nr:hypothetical protein E1A91_D01G071200v1 [Gossypium mustelinum]
MGTRGVIGDKWSMRILWGCAIGSAVEINGEWDILSASTVLLDIGPVGKEKVPRPRKMRPVRMHSAEK